MMFLRRLLARSIFPRAFWQRSRFLSSVSSWIIRDTRPNSHLALQSSDKIAFVALDQVLSCLFSIRQQQVLESAAAVCCCRLQSQYYPSLNRADIDNSIRERPNLLMRVFYNFAMNYFRHFWPWLSILVCHIHLKMNHDLVFWNWVFFKVYKVVIFWIFSPNSQRNQIEYSPFL